MDSNGTRFRLILSPDDWGRGRAQPVWGGESRPLLESSLFEVRGGAIELRTVLDLQLSASVDKVVTLADRGGMAIDKVGNVYRVRPSKTEIVLIRRSCAEEEPYFSAALGLLDPSGVRLRALVVTTDGWLVAGDLGRQGLWAFDLERRAAPVWIPGPTPEFEPWDLAALPGGGVVALDRVHATLTRFQGPIAPRPAGEECPKPGVPSLFEACEPETVAPAVSPQVRAAPPNAIAVATGGGEVAWVLSVALGSSVGLENLGIRWDDGVTSADRSLASLWSLVAEESRLNLSVEPHDLVVMQDGRPLLGALAASGEHGLPALVVVGASGNQAFAFVIDDLAADPRAVAAYIPLRDYSGADLLESPDGVRYVSGATLVSMARWPRPGFVGGGHLLLPPMDGELPGCVWHRVVIEGELPAGSWVRVASRASDTLDELQSLPWDEEPTLVLQTRSDLPWLRAESPGWELLLQRAVGRHLQLRLTVEGGRRRTPRIQSVRASFPRFSYRQEYLPAVYRREADHTSFTERFLALTEGFLTSLEDRVAASQVLLDPKVSPPEFLPWLAGWFGLAFDLGWEEARRRVLLSNLSELFRWRGTARGLRAALRLSLDPTPTDAIFDLEDADNRLIRITEGFAREQGTPWFALISLPTPCDDPSGARAATLQGIASRVVRAEAPAFLGFEVVLRDLALLLGDAALGAETTLSSSGADAQRPDAMVLGLGRVGYGVAGPPDPARPEPQAPSGELQITEPSTEASVEPGGRLVIAWTVDVTLNGALLHLAVEGPGGARVVAHDLPAEAQAREFVVPVGWTDAWLRPVLVATFQGRLITRAAGPRILVRFS
ncbi:MAG: hypothetical protein IPO67_19035 [Deltaproteobacteria bacterium]|nr:hypothetical protein [Deltaproteobacteria bacterium]